MPLCNAFTLEGVQCRRKAAVGSACCAQHIGLSAAEIESRRGIVARRIQEEENKRVLWARMQEERRRGIAPRLLQEGGNHAQARAPVALLGIDAAIAAVRPGLRGLLLDPQNVHRREVNEAQKPILDALAKRHNAAPDLMTTLTNYAHTPDFKLETTRFQNPWLLLPPVLTTAFHRSADRVGAGDYALETEWANGEKFKADLRTLLLLAVDCIATAPATQRMALNKRFLEELKEGEGNCLAGRFARVLNAFAGFEEVVLGIAPVDPRSLNERLGDAFAALSRKELDETAKRAEAERILNENGVLEPAARAVWLEAL